MKDVEILNAVLGDERIIKRLAWDTWWVTYGNIISEDQIRYMLEKLYDEAVLRGLIETGQQQFVMLREGGNTQAFAAYGARENDPFIYKLHKLYVHPDCHGKGFGRRLLNEVTSRLAAQRINTLELNVHQENPALRFYQAHGFVIVREEKLPFGPYWLKDFVMRLHLATPPLA